MSEDGSFSCWESFTLLLLVRCLNLFFHNFNRVSWIHCRNAKGNDLGLADCFYSLLILRQGFCSDRPSFLALQESCKQWRG